MTYTSRLRDIDPLTQQQLFFQSHNKTLFLEERYLGNISEKNREMKFPTHIVFFDSIFEDLANFLQMHNYTLESKMFHTHFPEGHVGKYILVFVKS